MNPFSLTIADRSLVRAEPGVLGEILQQAGAGAVLVAPIVIIATPATRPPRRDVRAATV